MPVSTTVKLLNKYGLHQRPAMKVIETSSRFKSDITLVKTDGRRCNAKSIIEVIMLAAECGEELGLEAKGPDEVQAAEAMKDLFGAKFHLNEE